MSMKNPLSPAGIEPATFRFVAQHLNHCATAVPLTLSIFIYFNDEQFSWKPLKLDMRTALFRAITQRVVVTSTDVSGLKCPETSTALCVITQKGVVLIHLAAEA